MVDNVLGDNVFLFAFHRLGCGFSFIGFLAIIFQNFTRILAHIYRVKSDRNKYFISTVTMHQE